MLDPTLPLIDLHRHLDGSVRLETILDLGRKHNLPLPAWDLETLRPYVQVTTPQPGIMAFIARFEWMVGILVDYDACWRVSYECVADLKREGVDYAELRFSPWFMAEPHHLDVRGVVEAVADGVRAAVVDYQVPVKLIGILSRTYGPSVARQELDALLTQRDHIAALDLAGDEARKPGGLFVEHFKIARSNGWQVTVHAGEADGAQSVRQAVRELGAARIGHALRIFEDPSVVEELREKRIGIEANLTSNVQTSSVPDYPRHPLKAFLENGLLASINTDDPGISGIDLGYELEVAAPAAGLSPAQIRQAQLNALETAFLSAPEREILLAHKKPA
jgi:adenosine deaminase